MILTRVLLRTRGALEVGTAEAVAALAAEREDLPLHSPVERAAALDVRAPEPPRLLHYM